MEVMGSVPIPNRHASRIVDTAHEIAQGIRGVVVQLGINSQFAELEAQTEGIEIGGSGCS